MVAMIDDPFATDTAEAPAGPQFGGTGPQGEYLRDLRRQLRDVDVELTDLRHGPGAGQQIALDDETLDDLTTIRSRAAASKAIDEIRQALAERRRELRIERNDARHRRAPADELEAGMYRRDGMIYKVQQAVHGSGRMYAKLLREDTDAGWMFEYAPSAIRRLGPEHRMTIDEAREFGALYGVCCRCAATLTDEESIARGIGPICAEKV